MKEDEKEEYHIKKKEMSNDETIMEYMVDTSKFCNQELQFDKIEFYPITFYDSIEHTYKPMLKSITKKKESKQLSQKGETESNYEKRTSDVDSLIADSITTHKSEVHEKFTYTNKGIIITLFILLVLCLAIKWIFNK